MSEVETIDEKLDELLSESKEDFGQLVHLIARFATLASASNAQLIKRYSDLVQDACRVWENKHEQATGIRHLCLASANFYSAKFSEVEEPALKAMETLNSPGFTDLFGLINMIYGSNNRSLGNLDIAVKHLLIGGEVVNENGPLAIYKAYSHYQLAEINNYIKDYEAAEYHYRTAVSIAEVLGDPSGLFRAYNGLACLFLSQENYPECKEYLDKSLALEGLSESQKSRSHCDMGVYYHKQADYQNAEKTQRMSYELRMADGLRSAASTSLINLAETQLELGKLDEALASLLEAHEIVIEFKAGAKELMCLHLMANVYSKMGEWQKSAEAFQNYDKMRVAHSIKQLQNIYTIKNEKIKSQKQTIENIYEEVQASIRYAKRIQYTILPLDKDVEEHLKDSFVLYKPKDIVSGDFYWLEPIDSAILFAVADCTGHGVPGALVSIVCNNALNRSVREFGLTDPGEILTKVREIVVSEFEDSDEDVMDGMDIALCSLDGNKLKYAGAYNPLWIISNGELSETKATKQPIGQCDDPIPFETHTLELNSGDTLYIASDGYVDQFGGKRGKKFKSVPFKELLLGLQSKTMSEQKKEIEDVFEKWKGNLEQVDDVCVIGVKI